MLCGVGLCSIVVLIDEPGDEAHGRAGDRLRARLPVLEGPASNAERVSHLLLSHPHVLAVCFQYVWLHGAKVMPRKAFVNIYFAKELRLTGEGYAATFGAQESETPTRMVGARGHLQAAANLPTTVPARPLGVNRLALLRQYAEGGGR